MSTVEFELMIARPLPESANEPEFAWFKKAYLYASNKTQAIPALSKCTPEEVFHLVLNMMRGLDLLEPHPTQPFAYEHPITRPLATAWKNTRDVSPEVGQEVLFLMENGRRQVGMRISESANWNFRTKPDNYVVAWCELPQSPNFEELKWKK